MGEGGGRERERERENGRGGKRDEYASHRQDGQPLPLPPRRVHWCQAPHNAIPPRQRERMLRGCEVWWGAGLVEAPAPGLWTRRSTGLSCRTAALSCGGAPLAVDLSGHRWCAWRCGGAACRVEAAVGGGLIGSPAQIFLLTRHREPAGSFPLTHQRSLTGCPALPSDSPVGESAECPV